ncbi:MAG: trypsin-like peptidase domain-containing protein [Nannocystaceae bacterium]|nr:trypsin-like peptidase domain-containing protein [Nannocystaceae bacterium]
MSHPTPSFCRRLARTTALAAAILAPPLGCDVLASQHDAETDKSGTRDNPGEQAGDKADAPASPQGSEAGANAKSTQDAAATLTANAGPPPVATPAVDPAAPSTAAVKPVTTQARTDDEQNSVDVFGVAAPATVFITQKAIVEDYSMRAEEVSAGTGTGFIWNDQGHIVTNCHVALKDCAAGIKAARLSVTLYDHSVLNAELVGFDPTKDIAVLKIEPKGKLVPMRRPPKDYNLVVGQKAIAIGNPFGLDHTLTVGVVSALGREVKGIGSVTIKDMVQTDAAINPGNSGGPLMDSSGQLLGMNTMIFSRSGSSAGIGFAVPYMSIERVVPQIIKDGKPSRVGLGIAIFGDEMSRRFGVEGVAVRTVPRETAAFKGGLRPPVQGGKDIQLDFIVGVDSTRIKTFDDLYFALDGKKAGDKIKLSIMRLPSKDVFDAEIELIDL